MNQHLIYISAKNQPAMLEQLLRVTRFRGFAVDKIAMDVQSDMETVTIKVSVRSERPVHLLENQLRKLVDIDEVTVAEPLVMQSSHPVSMPITTANTAAAMA